MSCGEKQTIDRKGTINRRRKALLKVEEIWSMFTLVTVWILLLLYIYWLDATKCAKT